MSTITPPTVRAPERTIETRARAGGPSAGYWTGFAIVVAALAPIRARYAALMQDPAELDRLLAHGAARARAVAEPKCNEIKRRMGLLLRG